MASGSQDILQTKFDTVYERATDEFQEGDFEDAERSLVEARKVALEMGGEGRRNVAACLNLLSAICAETERNDKAADLAVQAYQILAESSDESDEDIFGVASNAARFLITAGRSEEGVQMYEKARTHAISQQRPMDGALSYLHQARAVASVGGDKESVLGLLEKCLTEVQKDTHGDWLYEAAGAGAAMLYEMGEKTRAIAVLRDALKTQDTIYRLPVGDELKKNPAWVLDFGLARSIVFRENYQNEGVDPIPMNELRLLLADMLMDMEKIDEAIAEYERLDTQLRLERERANSEDDDDDDSADEEADDDDDLEDDDEEDGEDSEEEFEEDDEDLEMEDFEEGEGEYYLDRASFYAHYANALHIKGREEGRKDLLNKAVEMYDEASKFIGDIDEDEGEFVQELEEYKEEVQKDLQQL